MKRIGIGVITAMIVVLGAAIAHSGSWDNFKLRYYAFTQVFHDQNQELDDLRKQQQNPEVTARIELAQLLNGGPPKDGIPSIDDLQFDTAATTPFQDDDLVIGVVINGKAKAYPFNVLNWHEIVNDTVGGQNVTITYSYIWQDDAQTPHNQFSGESQQFIHAEIEQPGRQEMEWGDRTIEAVWDETLSTIIVRADDGTIIPSSTAFAFVYPAFFESN
ncbi:MAG: DUF3179 domain-containing protein [Cyanothece sp. SIO2G6]|nr:DUF3179 domain-containing protein [Cyanothece sp. SIO2G6]